MASWLPVQGCDNGLSGGANLRRDRGPAARRGREILRIVSIRFAIATAAVLAVVGAARPAVAECVDPAGGIGVARSVEIDTSAGPIFGSFTRQAREPSFLKPKEVVLTFDDGPMPWVTKSILDTLDKFCTKATFFSVGKMALAYPAMVKEVLARGHTLGTHTYSHPYNLNHLKFESAKTEIERGFAAVATAAGIPISPVFRFPGLSDSAALLGYLQSRQIAAFTVDVVSNDSYIHDKQRLIDYTLKEIEQSKGGIILFHDIKTTTAKALPEILTALKARGYSVVHIRTKDTATPNVALMSEMAPKLAKISEGSKAMLPFYGATGPEKVEGTPALDVTAIAPIPIDRKLSAAAKAEARRADARKTTTEDGDDDKSDGKSKVRKDDTHKSTAGLPSGRSKRGKRGNDSSDDTSGNSTDTSVLALTQQDFMGGWTSETKSRLRKRTATR